MNFWQQAEVPDRRRLLISAGHLAALWALAFAQPLFDLLGKTPDFFIARDNTPGDILILGLVFILVPPLLMLLVEWAASKVGARAWLATHLFLFTVLAAFIFIQLIDPLLPDAWVPVVLISLILGGLLAVVSVRVAFVRNLFDILIVAPVVVLVMFFFLSDTNRVIFPEEAESSVEASVGKPTPVVIVSFDELATVNLMDEKGEIDGRRFPNIGRLAREGTWYPNVSTISYFTPTAMPGILTGKRPADGALPTAAEQPDNIFSLLSDSYEVHSLEWITQLCAPEICPEDGEGKAPEPSGKKAEAPPEALDETPDVTQSDRLEALFFDLRYVVGRLVLPTEIGDELPDVGTNFEGFDDGGGAPRASGKELKAQLRADRATQEQYEKFIREIPTANRSLTMMHMKQPHKPWKYGTKGQSYFRGPLDQLSEGTKDWLVDDPGITSAQQRMLVQTGYADTLLGQIFDRLDRAGIWDEAMVVVTADHGISFEGNGVPQRIAGEASMGENANPPLFIKYPGQTTGQTDSRDVSTLDIVPTIARELEIDGMYQTDGFPLQGEVPDRDVLIKGGVSQKAFTVSTATMIAQRDEALKRQVERLGNGPIYTLGPAPELIGKPVESAGRAPGAAVELFRASDWSNYTPGQKLVPMYVTGPLTGIESDEEIVVTVNGRVRGTTRAFDFDGSVRFGTVIDPDSLEPGPNRIGVYLKQGRKLFLVGEN